MKFFQDNVAIPPLGRPKTPMFDGTWAGDAGFDPLAISGWLAPRCVLHCIFMFLADASIMTQPFQLAA